ncbi:hypothetical protein GCM10022252_40760 [Streptosporangium oxazolinicum]|uniref:Uncharacterized protein n=1 Tax=Streptosporangium oxazolinicum TaxID=909287 RepID=A0ABP8B0P9_9ACTN
MLGDHGFVTAPGEAGETEAALLGNVETNEETAGALTVPVRGGRPAPATGSPVTGSPVTGSPVMDRVPGSIGSRRTGRA